jgi:hypothetical protein
VSLFLPSTLETGSTYAVQNPVAIWALKNMLTRPDPSEHDGQIVVHFHSLMHSWGYVNKKNRGSTQWEDTQAMTKFRLDVKIALPPGSSVHMR